MWKPGIAFYLTYYVGIFVLEFFPLLSCLQCRRGESNSKRGLTFQLQALTSMHCLTVQYTFVFVEQFFFFFIAIVPFCVTFFLQLTSKKPSPLENAIK